MRGEGYELINESIGELGWELVFCENYTQLSNSVYEGNLHAIISKSLYNGTKKKYGTFAYSKLKTYFPLCLSKKAYLFAQ